MLKQIKTLIIVVVLVMSSMLTGCIGLIGDIYQETEEYKKGRTYIIEPKEEENINDDYELNQKYDKKWNKEKQEPIENEQGSKNEVVEEEVVPETYYCEWCESNTNHNSDNHIGICYYCGIELPASQMTFDGRSFHCGCPKDYSTVKPCDDVCWNCGSTNIYSHDEYGNYTCHDCGEMTQ